MKVLVTGGAGFIGSHLVEALVAMGDEVRVIDDLSTGKMENIHLGKAEFIQAQIDVTRLSMFKDQDVIYHLAADTDVAASMESPRPMATNIRGIMRVLEAANHCNVPRVVFASSVAARYNANPYGASKLCGEVLCEMYQKAFGLETTALRFGNVYGPRQRSDLTNPPVVAAFVKAACEGETAEVHGDGSQCRDFLWVGDAVQALLAAGTNPLPGERVIPVGSGAMISIEALWTLVAVTADCRTPWRYGPRRQGEVDVEDMDLSALVGGLGIMPETDIEKGVRKTIEWYRRTHGTRTPDGPDAA